MNINISQTCRGFSIGRFNDANGIEYSIQESSAWREEPLIWLGTNVQSIKVMSPNGWKEVNFKDLFCGNDFVVHDRMHLTQSQVKELLPLLQHFVEQGCLPNGQ